jgi:ribosomal protein S18 acetylase RimI-like enzyme
VRCYDGVEQGGQFGRDHGNTDEAHHSRQVCFVPMTLVRAFRSDDLDALYRIALATGDSGSDASHLYDDKAVVGHIYAAPYAIFEPESALVVEDPHGVAGYIVGAVDTRVFESRLEADWWPALRTRYLDPSGTPPAGWGSDERMSWLIHHPPRAPSALVTPYPSHLHINLVPRLQGQGLGKRLIDQWLQMARGMGSKGVHLGVSAANIRAIRFYRAYGLQEPALSRQPSPGVIWFAADLTDP